MSKIAINLHSPDILNGGTFPIVKLPILAGATENVWQIPKPRIDKIYYVYGTMYSHTISATNPATVNISSVTMFYFDGTIWKTYSDQQLWGTGGVYPTLRGNVAGDVLSITAFPDTVEDCTVSIELGLQIVDVV